MLWPATAGSMIQTVDHKKNERGGLGEEQRLAVIVYSILYIGPRVPVFCEINGCPACLPLSCSACVTRLGYRPRESCRRPVDHLLCEDPKALARRQKRTGRTPLHAIHLIVKRRDR